MNKVFLSHSSKQKGFVEIIANRLGKFNIVYDVWSFDTGNKTLDQIYQGIDSSGIFVYFISKESLESDWVDKEITKAEEYVKNGKLRRFLPFLIDNAIKHNDERIPEWIRKEYNLKYISKPTKCHDLIRQALLLVSWDLNPKKKELNQLFIGRTSQIKQFEERIYDFDKPSPTAIIISGLPSIGRRKFIKHVLVNSNKIGADYSPPILFLDSRNSIEDFIVKIYGQGYSHHQNDYILNLSHKSINEKISIASDLIIELFNNNDILFVLDNLCIVSKDGSVTDWFLPIIDIIKTLNNLSICVISQARTRAKSILHNKQIFAIEIPELEPYERKALFKSHLGIEKIDISSDDFKIISDQFTGFPEQITYTTALLLHEGVGYVIRNPHEIVNYNTEKVARLVRTFDDNKLALQVLKIFSESEFLSINILTDILAEDFDEAKNIIIEFSNQFIIEYIGNTREFMRLNDSVKDYVQRLGYKLNEKYSSNLKQHAEKAFNEYEIVDRDISDYVISFKEALKQGFQVPKEYLIPSHYVNAMRELYNYEKRFNTVIVLADRILQNENYMDKRIVREIRYWLCSALARKRDRRILEEVQKIDGPDHTFLLGFYYRLVGRHIDAILRLKETLEMAPYYYRANRELIQVYLNMEQYEEAFALARESYYNDKNNPYNLQSYFRCLISVEGSKQRSELNNLLDGLKNNPHEKAPEMYKTSLAQYYAYVENDIIRAIQTVDDAISAFPKNIYPYLTKLELLRRNINISKIRETISDIESRFDEESDIFMKLPFLSCKYILMVRTGLKDQALNILNKDIRPNFSNGIYTSLLAELNKE